MNIEFVDVSNVKSIGNTGGLYLFYGKGELLYLGKSANLRARVGQHLNGKANTVDICKFFESIVIIYVSDAVARDVLETILINTWKPKLNVDKVWTYTTDKWLYLDSDDEYVESQRPIQEAIDNIYLTMDL